MQDHPALPDWVQHSPGISSLERFDAFFGGHAFDDHRHDSYAIGRTLSGVHHFHYRGEAKLCLPGEIMILHPDEPHDGYAGSEHGFRYQGVHLPPSWVQQIVKGKALPFFKEGVARNSRLAAASNGLLNTLGCDPDSLEVDDAVYNFVMVLAELAGQLDPGKSVHFLAATRAREFIEDNLQRQITLDDLAGCSGRDRWSLSKDFRVFFGTSPHRYLTLRRLERVKALVFKGLPLSNAALEAGFFDQSHMSRHFKKAFGVSPSRWCQPR